jgi:hypothetical protein
MLNSKIGEIGFLNLVLNNRESYETDLFECLFNLPTKKKKGDYLKFRALLINREMAIGEQY